MVRTLLIVLVLLTLTGCPETPQTTTLTAEQIAAYQAELHAAQNGKGFWQSTATILGCLAFFTLAVGMVLGSKAKKDSDE